MIILIMAQPSITTPFRVTLLKVGECLTEQNVQDLAFLCEDIKPARRELLRNARELFVELQGHDLLNERNVKVLIGWLDELRLLEASKYLKDYGQKYLQDTTQYKEMCIEHESLVLKYYCASCACKVCSECALSLHDKNTHDVIKLDDVSSEIAKRRMELEREIETLNKRSEAVQGLWEGKRSFYTECQQYVRKQVHQDSIAMQEKAEKNKVTLLKRLDEKEISDFRKLIAEREEIEQVSTAVAHVQKHIHEHYSDHLSELRHICKTRRKCAEMKERIRIQEIEVVKEPIDMYYRRIVNDGTFGILALCSLVGSVILQDNQIVHLFDERQIRGTIRLQCFDPKDPNRVYWEHVVSTADHESPVVMSNIGAWFKNGRQLIFAIGRTVHIVRPRWTGSIYDEVEADSLIKVEGVSESCSITSITSYESETGELDEFVISISDSGLLRFYKLSGEVSREIETQDFVSSIICIAYVNNLAAFISRGRDYVILATADTDMKQNGFLTPPSSPFSLLPVRVIWTGAKWMVLLVSDENKGWKVGLYDKAGTLDKVCAEGTCGDMDVAISLTRWQNTGFVSFANNTVTTFEY